MCNEGLVAAGQVSYISSRLLLINTREDWEYQVGILEVP